MDMVTSNQLGKITNAQFEELQTQITQVILENKIQEILQEGELHDGLGTVGIKAGAAVFFEDIDSGLGVKVSGLVFSMLMELQAIALALENHCWIKHCHIANVIHDKNLDVNWVKIKGHSDILGNECADSLTRVAASSSWWLPHRIDERFLKTGDSAISGNSRHFVRNIFRSVHRVYWEVRSGFRVLVDSL
ncbi:hypothetical protein G9A89_014564 [Geosiphon pyriformis]|nr:hypothetical protein G9A89_014564 [Geosiphon pyriformis]